MSNLSSQIQTSQQLSYESTGLFNDIVLDYVNASERLRPFYQHPVNWTGLEAAMKARDAAPVDRNTLVKALKSQYAAAGLEDTEEVKKSIELLSKSSTYTVCTAHQPNLFTGYLYFIYKIVHAIKLAAALKDRYSSSDFVPVFYMGSEDADLEELGKIWLSGEMLVWNTNQTGAVGRMHTRGIEPLLQRINGELSVLPNGPALFDLLKRAYSRPTIQEATFYLIHELFKSYGLIVLIADQPDLKKAMLPVFEDDLFNHRPSAIVTETTKRLAEHYKVQANPREINLFYLEGDIRNRIEKQGEDFVVVDTNLRFTADEIRALLKEHPERFSPNVILRGLYQESILPNIAFIGGGGELAYWLELKDLFNHYKVPYPVQILRNSFLLVKESVLGKIEAMDLELADFFKPVDKLLNELVKRDSATQVHLSNEIRDTAAFYKHIEGVAGAIDQSLVPHVESLGKRATKLLQELEKKMLRAEKRKFSDQKRQLENIRASLFPNNGLQERVENFLPWYAQYGNAFIERLYNESPTLDQKFGILIW